MEVQLDIADAGQIDSKVDGVNNSLVHDDRGQRDETDSSFIDNRYWSDPPSPYTRMQW
jgi:hypothetical protein